MTDEEKLCQAYYEPDHLWTGNKAMKELDKIKSMSKKEIKSWLAKQALSQDHIPPPKEINHPHYDVREPNEQHQFDILYLPHNLFEGNTYKYILTGIDVASRYKVARPLRLKNQVKLHLCWKQSIKRVVYSNIPRHSSVTMTLSLNMK